MNTPNRFSDFLDKIKNDNRRCWFCNKSEDEIRADYMESMNKPENLGKEIDPDEILIMSFKTKKPICAGCYFQMRNNEELINEIFERPEGEIWGDEGKNKLPKNEKPPYLDRIDELTKVSIIRLKGEITRDMIPVIEARIKENRSKGSRIDKNVIVDFAKVVDVDSATVAFHLIHLEEYHQKGFEVAFINLNEEMKILLEMHGREAPFKVYPTEDAALKDLNR